MVRFAGKNIYAFLTQPLEQVSTLYVQHGLILKQMSTVYLQRVWILKQMSTLYLQHVLILEHMFHTTCFLSKAFLSLLPQQ